MTVPKNTWVHSEEPTAADLQTFSDSLDEIHAVFGDAAYNYATPSDVSSSVFYFVHSCRYLFYGSVGVIEDPSGVGDDVSLSEDHLPGINASRYDLDSVSWLIYGADYRVTGVSFCAEAEA